MLLPEIDPIIFQIGPVAIRWYGLTWLAAFSTIYFLIDKYQGDLDKEKLSDLMFYGLLGAIIGGRTGYIFFYSLISSLRILFRYSLFGKEVYLFMGVFWEF